jgi:diguanylate cyclase (GGDEF)-like protein/PAS domain S-box-containing protein
MALEFRAFALPFIVSAIVSLLVALLILQRQNVKGGPALALLMLQFALWAGVNGVRWSLVDPAAQVFWLKLSHAVFVPAPITFLIFVAQITDHDRWLTPANLLLLAAEPLVTMLVIATDDAHHLFYTSFQQVTTNGFPEMAWGRGPWFWFNTACSYIFLLAAIVILLRALLHAGPYVRLQLLTVLVGCVLPWGVNLYALVSPAAAQKLELTPLAAAASGLVFAYALFRQRLLDIVPVARGLLFEKLRDGVLVLDTGGRIVDLNGAARRILYVNDDIYGGSLQELLPEWRELGEAIDLHGADAHFELQGRVDPSRFYDVSATALFDNHDRSSGYLISLRDITERKQTELELHKMNLRLHRQVQKITALHEELREQAIRDALTGLYNRRYLDETLQREFSRARRGSYPISVIMMDIDGFKQVNDTYGHKAGDLVLRSLGEIIRLHVRTGDIPCRFGGEEFVIVMPETAIETAFQRAEQIRTSFQSSRFFKGQGAIVPSLSMGIAVYPTHGRSEEKLLHAADRAMYDAKSFGGNKALRYDSRRKIVPLPALKDRLR